MSTAYLDRHLDQLARLREILVALGQSEQVPDESHALFVERFDEMLSTLRDSPEDRHLGQDLICQVFHRYPQIAHVVPRDLLWFFGGDCLHYMPDEELALYQQLDERRYEAEAAGGSFDWDQEKQLLVLQPGGTEH